MRNDRQSLTRLLGPTDVDHRANLQSLQSRKASSNVVGASRPLLPLAERRIANALQPGKSAVAKEGTYWDPPRFGRC